MLVIRLLFGVVFFSVFFGLNVYLYRRMVRDVTASPLLRWLAIAAMFSLFATIPLMRFLGAQMGQPMLSGALLAWMGLALHTLMVLLLVELGVGLRRRVKRQPAQPPVDESKRLFLARSVAAGAATAGAGLSVYGAYRALTPPVVNEVPIKLKGLPRALDGFTIVHLTDIHVGAVIQERFLDQLVATANGAKPDLVAITGDLVDGPVGELGRYVARLQRLSSRHGTYFVSGNHDFYSDWSQWKPALTGLGFNVLSNRSVAIGDAGASFDLVGVDDWGTRFSSNGYDLDAALAGRDPARASVLLSHQPQNVEVVADAGLGLQLSGHTHGGQLFPGTLVGELIWGERNAGLSRLKDTFIYTSRGCGFVGPPMRVGAPPEVVKLVLVAS